MNMKRQRGRNNGRNKMHMPNRGAQTFDSSGPDVRIRGNAYQVLEKYLALARDATAAGDRIAAENFYQHAEHYYRVINANSEGHRQHMQHQAQQHQGQHQHEQRPAVMHEAGPPAADPGAGPQPLTGPQGAAADGSVR
jgi:hypothetical protein